MSLYTAVQATMTLRQRVYGILLQEKPYPHRQQHHVVEEWCMAGPGSLDQPNFVAAVPAQSECNYCTDYSDDH